MAGSLVTLPRQSPLNGGTTVAGAQMWCYEAGTTTKRAWYTTSAMSVLHSNPMVADSNGRFAAAWINPAGGSYKLVMASAADTDPPTSPFWTEDNITVPAVLSAANVFTSSGWTGTAATAPIAISGSAPSFMLNETDAAANNKAWAFLASSEALTGRVYSDDGATAAVFLTVDRTGTTVDSVNLAGTAIQANGVSVATITEGSFTGTLTGMSGATTGTVSYKVVANSAGTGKLCTLVAASGITGTSNTTALTMTGLPAACTPSAAVIVLSHAVDNGADQLALCTIAASATTVTFLTDLPFSTTGWTSSGTKGLSPGWQITYAL